MEKAPNEQGHLAARSAAIHMRFINNEQQLICFVRMKPASRFFPYALFLWPNHHVFQHGIIRNQNIWAASLYFKAGNQFCILCLGHVITFFQPLYKVLHIRLYRNSSLTVQTFKI